METKVVDVRKGSGDKKDLPAPKKVVNIEYRDQETGRTYAGDFTFKRLNLGDIRQMAVRRAQLNGGLAEETLDRVTRIMNSMLAHLEFGIDKAPDWWQPDSFYTGDVVVKVFEAFMEFQDSFRVAILQQGQGPEVSTESQAAA